jgi:hypothetical protein
VPGNASYSGPGTNESSCPFVCNGGWNLITDANNNQSCSRCSVGTWASPGSTECGNCTNLVDNARYSGVGINATSCAYKCDAGYTINTTSGACYPCPAGKRSVAGGACINCTAGSYGNTSALAICPPCATGLYSLVGATTCSFCANQGPFTNFISRGSTINCPFYCKKGSLLNRTLCVPCVNGTFASAMGSSTCTPCPPGTWSDGGSASCTACSSLVITARFVNATGNATANATAIVPNSIYAPQLGPYMPSLPFVSKLGYIVMGISCNN